MIEQNFDPDSIVVSDIEKNIQDKLGEKIIIEGITEYYQLIRKGSTRHEMLIETILVPLFELGAKKGNIPQLIIFFNRIKAQ